MTLRRNLTIVALAVSLCAGATAAQAQVGGATRGTIKARPRFFNPFVEAASSRFTINPFGVIALSPPSSVAAAASTVAAATAPAADDSVLGVAVSAAVRPGDRPTVRSPYRFPPRPPF
jgi:hypothetical protein